MSTSIEFIFSRKIENETEDTDVQPLMSAFRSTNRSSNPCDIGKVMCVSTSEVLADDYGGSLYTP